MSVAHAEYEVYFIVVHWEMSKQRGQGDGRKHHRKDGRKHRDSGKQQDMRFDEERFLRDMESALDGTF